MDDTSVSMAYYISAIQKISASNNDLTYFLFGDSNSDEIQALLDGENVVNVELNQRKGSEVNDLFLMSECKHIVLANSSFSWWLDGYLNLMIYIFRCIIILFTTLHLLNLGSY